MNKLEINRIIGIGFIVIGVVKIINFFLFHILQNNIPRLVESIIAMIGLFAVFSGFLTLGLSKFAKLIGFIASFFLMFDLPIGTLFAILGFWYFSSRVYVDNFEFGFEEKPSEIDLKN